MKTTSLKLFGFLVFSIFLNSCTTLLYTNLDVLRPAKVTFSPEIKKVLIVNNTVSQPHNYGHKTQLFNEKSKNVILATDSLSIFCVGSLTEELKQKEFFTLVELIPNSINNSTDFFYIKYLNVDTVKALCKRYNTDAIISLDRIKVIDKISEYYFQEKYTYIANLDVNYETQWSIHTPDNEKFTATTFRDTVFWETESSQRRKLQNGLPDRTNALIDGALYVGQNTVKRMIPYWEKVDRYFFSNKKKYIKQGIDSVYVKNWSSAIKSWETVIKKSLSNSTKAKAANNAAVAYEIIGNIDKAIEYSNLSIEYLDKSMNSDYKSYLRVTNYLQELQRREKEIKLLKKQLGE